MHPGQIFEAMDGAAAAGNAGARTLPATGLSVGYQDARLGYVELQARQVSGSIQATLIPSSEAAQHALQGQLGALGGWLAQRATPVERLAVAAPTGNLLAGGDAGSARQSFADARQSGGGAGTGSGTGYGSGPGSSGLGGSGMGGNGPGSGLFGGHGQSSAETARQSVVAAGAVAGSASGLGGAAALSSGGWGRMGVAAEPMTAAGVAAVSVGQAGSELAGAELAGAGLAGAGSVGQRISVHA